MAASQGSHESRTVTGRAFAVLDTFDAKHRRQSLASIARRAEMPLTTAHRLVHELVKQGALTRGVDGDYEIGSKLWSLGILASVHADLREVALPYMEDLRQLGNDVVQIAVLDGVSGLVVERIAGSRAMDVLSKPGTRLPLHATAVGKVLLAFGDDDLHEAVFGSLDRFTDQTITDAERLRTQIRDIKAQGFAQTTEELAQGSTSIAVPLRGKGGAVIASLGIIAPSGDRNVKQLIPVMQVTAAALSKKLAEAGLTEAARLPTRS